MAASARAADRAESFNLSENTALIHFELTEKSQPPANPGFKAPC
jgi:hypothetical protein